MSYICARLPYPFLYGKTQAYIIDNKLIIKFYKTFSNKLKTNFNEKKIFTFSNDVPFRRTKFSVGTNNSNN